MKRISYILGIALFILFTAGLLVIGFHAPQGEPPYSYLEAQKEEVSVDSFETRGIRGVEGFWLYDMPDANINIIIRTTNDPRKCRVTYPKTLSEWCARLPFCGVRQRRRGRPLIVG